MEKIKIELPMNHAINLLPALKEALHLARYSDADGLSEKNVCALEVLKSELVSSLAGDALNALANILSSPDEVLSGNGVSCEGKLYDDVKSGLEQAEAILRNL